MNTPEKEIKTIFAWTELDEENRACLAFALKKRRRRCRNGKCNKRLWNDAIRGFKSPCDG